MNLKFYKMKLHVKISILFAVLMLIISSILIYTSYMHLAKVIRHVNKIAFDRILDDTAFCLETDFRKISSEMEILAKTSLTANDDEECAPDRLLLLKTALDNNECVNAVYVGYSNGDLLLIRRLKVLSGYEKYTPPADSYYVVTRAKKNAGAELTFYSKSFNRLKTVTDTAYTYDATSRVWYKQAVKAAEVIVSPPYVFYSTKAIGITMAMSNPVSLNVIGFDYTMDSLLSMITKYSLSDETRTLLINSSGQILSGNYTENLISESEGAYDIVTVKNIVDPVINDYASTVNESNDIAYISDGEEWRGKKKSFSLKDDGEVYTVLTVTPERTLMVEASEYKRNLILAGVGVIILILPLVWIIAVIISKPLIYLSEQLDRLKNFDFRSSFDIESSVVEIDNLIKSSKSMMATIKKFQIIAETITKQKEYDLLLNTILRESTSIINGKGGAVYLFADSDELLAIQALYLSEKDKREQGDILEHIRENGVIERGCFDKYLKSENELYIENSESEFSEKGRLIWPGYIEDSDILLSIIPLHDSDRQMLGYIVFAHDKSVNDSEVENSELAFIKALSGFVSAAIEGQLLIEKRKELLQSLIMLIADAIDAKSPYTGKHCQRVPVITKMIMDEVCRSDQGEFADYNLNSDQWEEIRIASWLHDCGKVITPVDIVDKATKLECIYNRIHEIRMRFELIKSYADIAYWQGLYEGGDKAELARIRDDTKKELDAEFEFVAGCNIGGEFMSAEAIERLEKISRRVWQRTLDDTLGLSVTELKFYPGNAKMLPAEERLLADKIEHIHPKAEKDYEKRNVWGFSMPEPDNISNKGELYNLCIRRGTLTDEDRYIINAHMIHTIKILSKLPFPKNMQNIVEIAGSHHEKIDGGGYPRNIPARDLPIPARAMAIADIFEALTASDRPYKKNKTLGETLKIMKYMVEDGHIDRELFELFVRSGKAEEYARKYLLKEQQDLVNIDELLE